MSSNISNSHELSERLIGSIDYDFDQIGQRATQILNSDPLYRHEKGREIEISGVPFVISKRKYENICGIAESIHIAQSEIVGHLSKQLPVDFSIHSQFSAQLQARLRHEKRLFLSRYDFILDDDGNPKFIEFNSCCPAGVSFLHRWRSALQDAWPDSSLKSTESMILDDKQYFVKKLLFQYQMHYGKKTNPYVVIAKDSSNMTLELENFRVIFQSLGAKADIKDISELSYRSGKLFDDSGKEVDLVYCKVGATPTLSDGWTNELMAKYSAFLEAAAEDAVCIMNPFSALTVGEDKGILAALFDERYRAFLPTSILPVLNQFIPKTEFVNPLDAEQRARLLLKKDGLVLKARMETRGRFIVMGDSVTKLEWNSHLESCVPGAWVVQDRVMQSTERFGPNISSQTLSIYMVDGRAVGMMGRVSSGFITNVAQNGKIQPVFIQK